MANAFEMIARCAQFGTYEAQNEYGRDTVIFPETPIIPEEAMGHGDNSIDQQVST